LPFCYKNALWVQFITAYPASHRLASQWTVDEYRLWWFFLCFRCVSQCICCFCGL